MSTHHLSLADLAALADVFGDHERFLVAPGEPPVPLGLLAPALFPPAGHPLAAAGSASGDSGSDSGDSGYDSGDVPEVLREFLVVPKDSAPVVHPCSQISVAVAPTAFRTAPAAERHSGEIGELPALLEQLLHPPPAPATTDDLRALLEQLLPGEREEQMPAGAAAEQRVAAILEGELRPLLEQLLHPPPAPATTDDLRALLKQLLPGERAEAAPPAADEGDEPIGPSAAIAEESGDTAAPQWSDPSWSLDGSGRATPAADSDAASDSASLAAAGDAARGGARDGAQEAGPQPWEGHAADG